MGAYDFSNRLIWRSGRQLKAGVSLGWGPARPCKASGMFVVSNVICALVQAALIVANKGGAHKGGYGKGGVRKGGTGKGALVGVLRRRW